MLLFFNIGNSQKKHMYVSGTKNRILIRTISILSRKQDSITFVAFTITLYKDTLLRY